MTVLMRFTFLGGKRESYSMVQKGRHYLAISTLQKDWQGSKRMVDTRNVEVFFKKDCYCMPPKFCPFAWV